MPGSTFHGLGRPVADPAAVLAVARAAFPALAQLSGVAAIVELNRDYYEVQPHGASPVRIRLRVGPLAGDVVAQTVRDADGNYTLTVSERATDPTVARALAHEAAELAALHATSVVPAGPLDGGPVGPINPAGLTPHDRGRLAEVRLLAATYPGADQAGRVAIRAELDALADHLGLRTGTADAMSRWPLLSGDVSSALLELTTREITPAEVATVLKGSAAPTDNEHIRLIDYRSRLTDAGQPLDAGRISTRLRELNVAAEQAQNSTVRLSAYAGQIIGLPAQLLADIRQVDPQLADRVASEGVYVNLTGRLDLRAYAVPGAPEVRLDAGSPAYDLTTPQGRQALLAEDRARAEAAIRVQHGNPATTALLAGNSLHYVGDARVLMMVPDALTTALAQMAPPEQVAPLHEATATWADAAHTAAVADRVTLPTPAAGRSAPDYGRPVDPATGQPVPLFNGVPVREQVAQGKLGDCGMLATIAAVAGHRPGAIGQLLSPNPDGSVDVLLHESTTPGTGTQPTGRQLRITVRPDVPTRGAHPGESEYAEQVGTGAAWASLVEKAIAAVDRTWSESRRDTWQRQWTSWTKPLGAEAAPVGYGRMDVGSTPALWAELLTQLTGEPARTGRFDSTPGTEPATEAMLASVLAAGNPVIVSTRGTQEYPAAIQHNLPHGLVAGHAYELVEVGNGHVRLRNPWNTQDPAVMTIRDFLDFMARDYAHLDAQPAPPVQPAQPIQPQYPPQPPHPPAQPVARGVASTGVQHGPGRVVVDDQGYSFVYYAVLSVGGAIEGLTVVEILGGEPRSARWTTGPDAVGAGGDSPVTRPEAERIAAQVLGFALPDEATLHGMLGG